MEVLYSFTNTPILTARQSVSQLSNLGDEFDCGTRGVLNTCYLAYPLHHIFYK